jgi:aldehyde dehydrogenase (NAD+)
VPAGVLNLVVAGSSTLGDNFLSDKRIALISVTGSVSVGRHVAKIVGDRLGKTILELGGNNAIIISQYGNKDMALRASLFGAIATAGQRYTTTRRLIIHECMYEIFREKLVKAYQQVKIGNPLDESIVIGPLVDRSAVDAFLRAQEEVVREGGRIIYGGQVFEGKGYESGCYVVPCIAEAQNHYQVVQEETFAPILYLIT